MPVRTVPLARSAEPTIDNVAHAAGVGIGTLRGLRHAESAELLRALSPDVIAVACFPWKLPPAILALPPLGCVNVHPSLLPRWRGPEPLFWTFRAGDAHTGVTVHLMDAGVDSGPVLGQSQLEIPAGIGGDQLERRLASDGGALLVQAIRDLANGRAHPRPQDLAAATFARSPAESDLVISTDLPAVQVYSYIRGVAPLWGSILVAIAGTATTMNAIDALDFDQAATLPEPVTGSGRIRLLRCNPGVVTISVEPGVGERV